MTATKILFFLLLITSVSSAQKLNPKDQLALNIPETSTYSTDNISSYIKNNFQSDSDRARAIFVWIAHNIEYDVAVLQSKINPTGRKPVEDILRTRKAICGGYTDLFTELSNKCNMRSVLVGGYTKNKGAASKLTHAWPAVETNKTWFLYDPTWAAGYVENDQFTKNFSETYYKLKPSEMIRDHMPFDPMYQFLEYPLTNKEFMDGKPASNRKQVFNYVDTLNKFNASTKDQQVMQQMRRMQANGIENDLIDNYIKFLARQTEAYGSQNGFQQAQTLFNQAIDAFNGYMHHKNKQFTGFRDDKEVKHALDSASYYSDASWATLGSVVARNDQNRQALAKTYKAIDDLHSDINKEKSFIERYINTDKPSRMKLFMKKP